MKKEEKKERKSGELAIALGWENESSELAAIQMGGKVVAQGTA